MKLIEHHKPWSVAIELTYGCNRLCDSCGLGSIVSQGRKMPTRHMSMEVAEGLAKEIGTWLGKKRIEFVARGEALLHPQIVDILKMFRKHAPKCQFLIATNGQILQKEGYTYVKQLFDAGLNILAVDAYSDVHEHRTLGKVAEKHGWCEYKDCYGDKFNPFIFHHAKKKYFVLITDVMDNSKNRPVTRKLVNIAGNVNFKKALKLGIEPTIRPLIKKCTKPFREIVIHADGVIPVCCFDYRHEYTMGIYPTDGTLAHIWNNKRFQVARHCMLDRKRIAAPCYKCDYFGGFRQGFLKETVTEVTEAEIKQVILAGRCRYQKYVHESVTDPPLYVDKSRKHINIFKFLRK